LIQVKDRCLPDPDLHNFSTAAACFVPRSTNQFLETVSQSLNSYSVVTIVPLKRPPVVRQLVQEKFQFRKHFIGPGVTLGYKIQSTNLPIFAL